jgi:triose/dihydroxyacetone kinase / FAD-AMP lyase (cyclizing)
MGIHNEEGFGRVKTTLPGLVSTMLKQLLDQSDKDRGFINIQGGEDIVLLINNLGGISQLELGAITAEVTSQLDGSYRLKPRRILCGTYMSSLNGQGFSITLLRLRSESWLGLIDAPASASGWLPPVEASNWNQTQEVNGSNQDNFEAHEKVSPSNLRSELDTFFPIL